MMPGTKITIYATQWCGDCRRIKRFLMERQIEFVWIDIDKDKTAEQFVKSTNRGNRSVPTLVFEDGSVLVEPSNAKLAEKLGIPLNSPVTARP